jgi:hypothetical protein
VEFPPVPLMPDLIELLQLFAKRINTETTYFLKHMLGLSDSPETVRLARRVLPVLNQENQVRLKEALANFPTTPRK